MPGFTQTCAPATNRAGVWTFLLCDFFLATASSPCLSRCAVVPHHATARLAKAIAQYAGPKGKLQFPLDEPIPYAVIERMVKLRVEQDSAKAAAKRKMKSRTSSKQRASK